MKQDLPVPRFYPNEEIDSIRLLKVLRVRNNGEVWCAGNLETGELCAVKFLYPEVLHKERFYAAGRFLQKTNFPSIIKGFQTGTAVNGASFMVMEYAPGGSLREVLKRCGRITFPQGVSLMRQMLNALCLLQQHGAVHRDIKPENIWIAADGTLRLGDFGIARFPEVPEEAGRIFGTARYCAPEQAVDSSKADFRSDLYSLGAVLFEALSGTYFRSTDSFSDAVRKKEFPDSALDEFSTPGFTGLIAELLAFSPAARPASPREVLEKLDTMGLPESDFAS